MVNRLGGEAIMKTATVSKLKASLSEYLRQVKAGEEVLVTERGRPIAKLTPAVSSAVLPQHLAEMEKQGLVKIGRGRLPKNFWALPRPKDPKGLVVKALLRERDEGR
jgi:prevent-host-death family protein